LGIKKYLIVNNENRQMQATPPSELDPSFANFVVCVKTKGGHECEPPSPRGMLGNFGEISKTPYMNIHS
jgi:hypothetical protein